MEIGMLNFLSVIICLCNGAWNSLKYRYENAEAYKDKNAKGQLIL